MVPLSLRLFFPPFLSLLLSRGGVHDKQTLLKGLRPRRMKETLPSDSKWLLTSCVGDRVTL